MAAGNNPERPAVVASALVELDRLARDRPALNGLIAVLRDVLPLLFADPFPVAATGLARENVRLKLAGGVPVLRGETVTFDEPRLRQLWESVRQCARVDLRSQFDPGELMRRVLAGDDDAVGAAALKCDCDPALFASALRLTLLPLLAGLNEVLVPAADGLRWQRGYCPTCGSRPLLGELRGLEQGLFLRCGWCAASWDYPRLRCPFCETDDHRLLGFLTVEGKQDGERAAICDACRGYVKIVPTLGALSAPSILIADVRTLHLDLIAAERGYV